MNALIQDDSLLIGSQEAIKKLSVKEQARLLVISDSHGNKNAFTDILREHGPSCDALIFCGDGIEDIAYAIRKAVLEQYFIMSIPSVIALVEGNNDPDLYPLGEPFKTIRSPLIQSFTVCGKTIMISHSHRLGIYSSYSGLVEKASELDADICFYGHTHVAEKFYDIGSNGKMTLFLNPGSCSRPRQYQPPSFAKVTLTYGSNNIDCKFYEYRTEGSVELTLNPE